jgi:hypothetical protein
MIAEENNIEETPDSDRFGLTSDICVLPAFAAGSSTCSRSISPPPRVADSPRRVGGEYSDL